MQDEIILEALNQMGEDQDTFLEEMQDLEEDMAALTAEVEPLIDLVKSISGVFDVLLNMLFRS